MYYRKLKQNNYNDISKYYYNMSKKHYESLTNFYKTQHGKNIMEKFRNTKNSYNF